MLRTVRQRPRTKGGLLARHPAPKHEARLVFFYKYSPWLQGQRHYSGGLDVFHRVAECAAQFMPATVGHRASMPEFRPAMDIAVYAETVKGNPLNATKVVRWALFLPVPEIQATWAPTDTVVGYVETYAWVSEHVFQRALHTERMLCWVHVPEVQRPWVQQRHGAYFSLRKSRQNHVARSEPLPPLPTRPQWVSIEGKTHGEVIELLRQAEIFATYDLWTFTSLLAAMNGCVSLVVPHPDITKEQYHAHWPMAKYGVAYGEDELEWARGTMFMVEGHLRTHFEDHNVTNVQDFVAWVRSL